MQGRRCICGTENSQRNQLCISCGHPLKHIAGVPYVDLGGDGTDGGAGLPEDARIDLIGQTAMAAEPGRVFGIIVEATDQGPAGEQDKAQRYINKLLKKFPRVRIVGKGPGPVPATVLVTVAAPLPGDN